MDAKSINSRKTHICSSNSKVCNTEQSGYHLDIEGPLQLIFFWRRSRNHPLKSGCRFWLLDLFTEASLVVTAHPISIYYILWTLPTPATKKLESLRSFQFLNYSFSSDPLVSICIGHLCLRDLIWASEQWFTLALDIDVSMDNFGKDACPLEIQEAFLELLRRLPENHIPLYTDGSKTSEAYDMVGASVYIPHLNASLSHKLSP